MNIIVPCSNKGGVGKTCVTAILADYFSKILKKRTLVIDLDPQCNMSQRILKMDIDPNNPEGHRPPIHPDYKPEDTDWTGRSSIADIFLRPQLGVVPYPTLNEFLDIMPAHASDLLAVELCKKNEVLDKIYNRFDSFLNMPDIQSEYEIVIIDTAPSKGPLTRSAMRAATEIIIPSQMEDKPLRGVFGMMQLWVQEKNRRDASNPLNLIGILPNMYDSRTALHTSMYEDLMNNENMAPHLMSCKLSRRINYAENDTEDATPKSIFDLPASNKARIECNEMCEFVVIKLNEFKLQKEKQIEFKETV